ncbi:hypothetical protein AK830_g8603 [Neonectria ditissima]|uniref:Uncharacterized protein n=1 Tax=Neonectria ditissima TaxID=78410 RepID=A0A0N8H649_9HYPO|nr:hypothetical protein AK830_g8603 [Neonectria ditissima]
MSSSGFPSSPTEEMPGSFPTSPWRVEAEKIEHGSDTEPHNLETSQPPESQDVSPRKCLCKGEHAASLPDILSPEFIASGNRPSRSLSDVLAPEFVAYRDRPSPSASPVSAQESILSEHSLSSPLPVGDGASPESRSPLPFRLWNVVRLWCRKVRRDYEFDPFGKVNEFDCSVNYAMASFFEMHYLEYPIHSFTSTKGDVLYEWIMKDFANFLAEELLDTQLHPLEPTGDVAGDVSSRPIDNESTYLMDDFMSHVLQMENLAMPSSEDVMRASLPSSYARWIESDSLPFFPHTFILSKQYMLPIMYDFHLWLRFSGLPPVYPPPDKRGEFADLTCGFVSWLTYWILPRSSHDHLRNYHQSPNFSDLNLGRESRLFSQLLEIENGARRLNIVDLEKPSERAEKDAKTVLDSNCSTSTE